MKKKRKPCKREEEEIKRLATVVRDSNDAITIQDFEGRITAWNHGAELMYGYSEEEALQMNIGHLTPPDKEAEQKEFTRRLIAGEAITTFETQRVTKDGHILDVWLTVTKLVDDAGKVIGIASTERDITLRRRAEEEIRRGYELFELVCRGTHDTVWNWNLKTDALWWNENFQKLFGYRAEEIEPDIKSWMNRIHPEDLDRVKTGIHAAIEKGKLSWHGRYRFRHSDGSYREIYDRGYILREAGGAPVQMIGAMQDITDRKKAEAALRESEERYRSLYNDSKDAIMIVSPEKGFLAGNPATVELFGCRDENNFTQKTPAQLSPEYQPDGIPSTDKAQQMMALAMERGSHFFEWTHRRMDGTVFPATVLLSRFEIGGAKVLQATVRDITERKRAEDELKKSKEELLEWGKTLEKKVDERTRELEKAQQKIVEQGRLAVLGQVSASLSHELRTPLTGIRNSVYLMQMLGVEKHDPKIAESMAIINMEIDACARVLNNMLDFVMPKAPMPKETRLDVIINNMLSKLFIPSNVKVSKMFQEGLPPLMLDALQMQQAFENIIKNALEAMSVGGELAISAKVSGDRVVVEFSDTGVGILHENLSKLFDPLFSTTPTGVGLGLTIARQLIDAHGGTIEASSQLGKGTTFTIKFPIK